MDADTLDLFKENIQPLRQGRKASRLGLALKAENDIELQEKLLREREQHELSIMTYDGEDPLEPRYDYVLWLEQSYPKHGREIKLIPLLEDTIMMFKDDDRYKQDPRFVELIVRYIETQENVIELYKMVHGQGIGISCSILYKSWAEALDAKSDLKRADHIYQLGISNFAQPLEPLRDAHRQFQLSVGRRMMKGELPLPEKQVSAETSERQRKVLGQLKKSTSVGIGQNVPTEYRVLGPTNKTDKGNPTISIYQEDENGNALFGNTNHGHKVSVINSESTHKENKVKPHPWNQGFKKKDTFTPVVPSTPTFEICVDSEDTTPQAPKSRPTPVTSKVLKIRKAEIQNCPMALFKSPHPGTKPYMPKYEAFAGGREFSFEELRWAYKKYGDEKKDYESVETPMKGLMFTPCKTPSSVYASSIPPTPEDHSNLFATPMKKPLMPCGFYATPLTEVSEEDANCESSGNFTSADNLKNKEIQISCDAKELDVTSVEEIKTEEIINDRQIDEHYKIDCTKEQPKMQKFVIFSDESPIVQK